MKDIKSIYELSLDETIVEQPKQEWHPKYEAVGLWARQFIKQYFKILIVYGVWGFVFGLTYKFGGYSALIISIAVSIIYTIRNIGEQLTIRRN